MAATFCSTCTGVVAATIAHMTTALDVGCEQIGRLADDGARGRKVERASEIVATEPGRRDAQVRGPNRAKLHHFPVNAWVDAWVAQKGSA